QGEQRMFQVQLRNYSQKPIRVVGGTTSCACIATQDLPVTIAAGGSVSLNVRVRFSGSSGSFGHRFILYSDSEERLTIARFSGKVLPDHTVTQSETTILEGFTTMPTGSALCGASIGNCPKEKQDES